MPSDDELTYEQAAHEYEAFGKKVHALVGELLHASGLVAHSVTYRVKARKSTLRKMEAQPDKYASLSGLHDLLGVRVVTYFADQVQDVANLFSQEFEVDAERSIDKRLSLAPDRFGYLSLHYVVSLGHNRSNLGEWRQYSGKSFEVQIRSILQHSWAEIEHDLGYKSPTAIPDPLKRRFSRLAGLLEIADDEFTAIRSAVEAYGAEAKLTIQSGGSSSIDQTTILALIGSVGVHDFDVAIASQYGAPLVSTPSDRYAANRADELSEAGFSDTNAVVERLRDSGDNLVRFAVAWLNRPDPSAVIREEHDSEGRLRELSPGISLFYLYLHEIASTVGVSRLEGTFLTDPGEADAFDELHRGIFGIR